MKKWNFYTSDELKPCGWLKRQLEIQANGLSGHLDKMWPDIRDSAWIGGESEGWERVPYWLDGFIPLAYLLEDADMISRAKKYIDAILNFQQPDGWICPCKEEKIPTYDTWAVLLISKVLTVYYDCSKDSRIPDVLYRVMKNYYSLLKNGKIKLFEWGKYRWYEGFVALNFLYGRFREAWIQELAVMLKNQGMDYDEAADLWKRPLNKWTHETHIVNIAMMLKSEALSCGILGQPYINRAERYWEILNRYNGTAAGIFTGDECLAGISPIQGSELCSVVELMYSCECLYAYTGDRKWAERLEKIAFNAFPATVSDDMWTHQYDQMSNQISCQKFPGKALFRTNGPESHLFGLEPNYGCCTANFNQGWPKLALSVFMYAGNEVISVLPVPSELNTKAQHITVKTEYPFENSFLYEVEAKEAFTLRIRIPSFAENLRVNGNPVEESELVFHFRAGEKVNINIAFETKPVMVKRPYGMHTVECGSLVFSVPVQYSLNRLEYEKDGVVRKYPYCDYELIPKSNWNYAYCSDALMLQHHTVSDVPFSSEKPPVTVRAYVCPINWEYEDGYDTVCARVPSSAEPIGEKTEIMLYPYGCAKLRMTELPSV